MPTEPSFETLMFDDGSSGTVHVEWLDGNRYRIVGPEIAVMTEDYAYGDIVEAIRNDDKALVVKQCLERGNYRKLEFCLSPGWDANDAISQVLDKIRRVGGQWEGIFGGVLLVALPPDADYDPTEDIRNAISNTVYVGHQLSASAKVS